MLDHKQRYLNKFFSLTLFIWLFFIPLSYAENTVLLSESEKEWIEKHPVVYFSESPWAPLSIVKGDQFSGILADYLTEISLSTGINFQFVPAMSWPETLKKFRDNDVYIIPGAGNSIYEQSLGMMSQSFLRFPLAIVTRDDADYVDSLATLSEEVVTVPKAFTSHQFLKQNYPHLQVILTDTIEESMALVSSGKADIFLSHISVAIYNINSRFTNLKISGFAEFEFQHHMLIQNDMRPLVSIVNKALNNITENKKREIYDAWVKVEVKTEVDYRIVYIIVAISAAVIIAIFIFSWRLKYLVRERTKKLNKLLKLYSNNVIASESDKKGKIRYVSNALCEISGYKESELLKVKYNLARHPDTSNSFYEKIWKTIDSGKAWAGEIKKRRKNGTDYWVYEVIHPEFDINNNITGFNSIEQDITAHKEVESLSHEIEETQREVVFTMGAIGETRSKETGNHVKRVAEYSKLLAVHYGLSEQDAEIVKQASPMHDIGKVAIPDSILNKPGKLNEEEFEIMKTHAEIGYQMLKSSNRPILKAAALIAHQHHEKYDGSGYPAGLKGEQIHIYGRIIALADVFDALGSDRVYKKAWGDSDIFALLTAQKGKHFDPQLIDIFFQHLSDFIEVREKFRDV